MTTIDLAVCINSNDKTPFYVGEGLKIPPHGGKENFLHHIKEIAEHFAINITWVHRPWKRCEVGFMRGKFDAVIGAIYTPQRSSYAAYPRTATRTIDSNCALGQAHYHFYENITFPLNWETAPYFENKRISIAAPRGFMVTRDLILNDYNISEGLDPLSGFTRLVDGHIHAYLLGDDLARQIIPLIPNAATSLRRIDPPVASNDLFMPIRRDLYVQDIPRFEKFWMALAQHFRDMDPDR